MIVHKRDLVIDEIELEIPEIPHHDDIVWGRITIQNASPVYIGSYYRSTSSYSGDTPTGLQSSLDHISTLVKNNSKATVIIGGDFNAGDCDWANNTVSENSTQKTLCENLIKTLDDHGLNQMVREPTREDRTLDLFCTNKPNLISDLRTVPGYSDHDYVVVDSSFKAVYSKKQPRRIYKWSRAEWEPMKKDTLEFVNQYLASDNEDSVQTMYDKLLAHIKKMLKEHVPSGWSRTSNSLPWISPSIRRQCKKKQRMYNKARKTKKSEHWAKYKVIASETRKQIKQAHWQHLNRILESAQEDKNPKPFWQYVKSQQQDSVGVAPLRDNGQLHSDPGSKAKILQQQFCSVFTRDKDCSDRNRKPNRPDLPCIGPLSIVEEGVKKLLLGINPSKASGPDEVAGRLLKELATELAPLVTCLFNKSITSSDIPREWKSQWVSPVYKKGTKSEAANYRPVSLTCILSKLMEHTLCTHIRAHLDKHSVLSPFQHGFRSRHSCDTQLLLTTHDLQDLYDRNLQTDIAILDFSKAFDVVPHQRLLNKLENYGIKGPVLKWISNFLVGRQQQVVVDGTFSKPASVDSGVPQGTVLGPLLFLVFINDLPDVITHGTRVRLFADDCLLYRPIKSPHDQIILQNDIDRLIQWSKDWSMKFNASKCNIMSVKRGLGIHRFYHMDGHVLASTSTAKYLGITFTDNLSWSLHVAEIAKRANQKLGFCKRNLRGSPAKCKALAYTALIRSGLEYAASIWDPYLKKDINLLECVQRKSARWTKSDYSWTTSVTTLLNDLKWAELEQRRKNIRLSLLYKIVNYKVEIELCDISTQIVDRTTRRGAKLGTDFNQKLFCPAQSQQTFANHLQLELSLSGISCQWIYYSPAV